MKLRLFVNSYLANTSYHLLSQFLWNNDNKQNSKFITWPLPLTLTSISFKWTKDFISKDFRPLRLITYEFIQQIAYLKFSKGNNSHKMSSDHSSQINQITLKSRRTIWWKQFAKIFYGFRDIAITRKRRSREITPIRISVRSHRVSFEASITVQHHWPKISLICCKTKKHLRRQKKNKNNQKKNKRSFHEKWKDLNIK